MVEREYLLILLFLVGTASSGSGPWPLGMCASVVVGIGLYFALPAEQKWSMKHGGIGSRKID